MRMLLRGAVVALAAALVACAEGDETGDSTGGQADAVTDIGEGDQGIEADVAGDQAGAVDGRSDTGSDLPDAGEQPDAGFDQPDAGGEEARDDGVLTELEQDQGPGPETVAGEGCAAITLCVTENQCKDAACVQECMASASAQAKAEFQALAVCAQTNCDDAQTQMDQLLCLYEECREQNEPCVTTGTATCQQTVLCTQGCQDDADCRRGCLSQATYDAMVSLLKLVKCIEDNCPQSGSCVQTTCNQQFQDCIAS